MLQWACASVGAILVTLNPAYRVHELVSPFCLSPLGTYAGATTRVRGVRFR